MALLTASDKAYFVFGLGLRWSGKFAQAAWLVWKNFCKGNLFIIGSSNDLILSVCQSIFQIENCWLDTIVLAYRNGDSAEEIVESFDTLNLSDVYAIISYYLDHQAEVENYLQFRQKEAQQLHYKIEQQSPSHGLRERLLARQKYHDQTASVNQIIEDMVLLATCSVDGEWEGQIHFLPL